MAIKLDRADQLFGRWIKIRDNWTCQRCGRKYEEGQGLQCSHFQGRRKENTRYEPLNCDALCYGCHAYFGSNPGEHYEWQVNKKGQNVVNKLILASNTYRKKDRVAEALYWAEELKTAKV